VTRAPSTFRRVAVLATAGAVVGACFGGAAIAFRSKATFQDGGTRDALLKIPTGGPAVGEWTIKEGDEEKTGRLEEDPTDATQLRWITTSASSTHPRARLGRYLLGPDPDLFLANYAPVGPVRHEVVNGRPVTESRFGRADGCCGPQRWLTMDDETGELVGIEDHAFDGTEVRSARLTLRVTLRRRAPSAPSSLPKNEVPDPAEIASLVSFPIYEPSRLPAGYRRTHCTVIPAARTMPETVLLRYGDGLASMDLFLTRPENLAPLVGFAKRLQRSAAVEVCPAAADTPEDLVEGSVVIRRRADRCRTVLQREDLPGVSAVLVAYNEIEGSLYVETMRSLAPVKAK
jgi:hypothetical protein